MIMITIYATFIKIGYIKMPIIDNLVTGYRIVSYKDTSYVNHRLFNLFSI